MKEVELCAKVGKNPLVARATPVRPQEVMPWGQTIAYVADIKGLLVELCKSMG